MLQVLESSSTTTTSDLIHQTVNDSSAGNMLTNGSNQYIQPDYLSPLPTTLDSKRSPLALLAQTCSQIGADPTTSTTTSTTSSSSSSSSSISVTKSVDKPSKKTSELHNNEKTTNRKTPPQSKQYLDAYGRQEAKESESKSGFKSPSNTTKSVSPAINTNSNQQQSQDNGKFITEQRIALDMAMQQQQQQQLQHNQLSKDIQQSMLANAAAAYHHRPSSVFPSPLSSLSVGHHPLSAYHHPGLAGLDAATAAALGAFRHPAYSSVAHHLGYAHHVPVSLGLSLASYQQALSAVSYGQRLQQQQQQHPNSKNSDVAICRDPYCTGCPNSSPASALPVSSSSSSSSSPNNNNNSPTSTTTTSSSSNTCPAGCTQCDHVTRTTSATHTNTSAALGLMSSTAPLSSNLSMSTSTPSTIVTSTSDASSLLRPYVCNWIAADHYCGKRFTSSEELLQHLRTHTSLSVASQLPPAVPAETSLSSPSSSTYAPHHQLLNPSLHPHSAHLLAASAAALHRTYPTPPLSPLSMARYHPYGNSAASKHLNSTGALQQHSPLSSSSSSSSAAVAPSAPIPPAPSPHNPLMSLHHPYAAASLAGLPGYYSTHPYSLYSQRMLAGAGVLP